MLYLDNEDDASCFYDCVSQWNGGQRLIGEVCGILTVLLWRISAMDRLSKLLLVHSHEILDDRGGYD